MSLVNNIGGQSDVLSDLSINNKQVEREETEKDMFMRLLLAQMENQNPLNPQDGTEFVSQLAELSTLEGIGNMTSSVEELSGLYRSSQALQATTLVGREVLVESNQAYFDAANPVSGQIKAPGQSVLDAKVTITDARGQVVRTDMLGSLEGDLDTPFAWDGVDNSGNIMPPGQYTISVNGRVGGEIESLQVNTYARVNSVSILNSRGDMELKLTGLGSLSSSEIKEVR